MSSVIQFPNSQAINVAAISSNSRQLESGLIAPATEVVVRKVASDHTSEPIKKIEDINRISDFLLKNERYRDNMLFIVGINFGLRVSDLRLLRFSDLITSDFKFKDAFAILEKKTRNTRKRQKNRYIAINAAVVDAVTTYLVHESKYRVVTLSDYLFRSESNHGISLNKPIHRNSVDMILKGIARDLDLDMKVSTHTLRKTFGYHQMLMSGNDPRKLLILQQMFGHSTSAQTLDYIGITSEEIEDAYRQLNLGSKTANYLVDSNIVEIESKTPLAAEMAEM